MGWASGINSDGREVGYAIEAECDHPECHAQINRGLSYICGSYVDGGDHGCGNFFCGQHLHVTLSGPQTVQLCAACFKAYIAHFAEEE